MKCRIGFERFGVVALLVLMMTVGHARAQWVEGTVRFANENQPASYARVDLPYGSLVQYADSTGRFLVDTTGWTDGSMRVTTIGGAPVEVRMSEWVQGDRSIFMIRPAVTLDSLQVVAKFRGKPRWINDLLKGGKKGAYVPQVGTVLITRVKPAPGKSGLLKRIEVHFESTPHPAAIMRLRVFRYNAKRNVPGEEVQLGQIFFHDRKGASRVDLTMHGLFFPPDGLCIGVEWVGVNAMQWGPGQPRLASPAIGILRPKEMPQQTWSWQPGQGWVPFQSSSKVQQPENLRIGVEVQPVE